MPRLNDVLMTGLVKEEPEVKYDADGTPIVAVIEVLIIRGERDYGDSIIQRNIAKQDISHYGIGNVWVMTNDPVQIDIFRQCIPYDLVMFKGCLRIQDIRRRTYCPDCNQQHIYHSRKTTIYPLYFERVKSIANSYGVRSFLTQSVSETAEDEIRRESFQELRNRIEISNTIHLIGVVCEDPIIYRNEATSQIMMSFPFAVKRKYFIPEDDMRVNVDFPYIKLYGGKAKEQAGRIKKGNLLMIDGFVSTRRINRKMTCENCGSVFLTEDRASDVVGYSIEYLRENISDVVNTENDDSLEKQGLLTHAIGSEADTDLRQRSAEEIIDEQVASGYDAAYADQDTQDLIKAVTEMNDA